MAVRALFAGVVSGAASALALRLLRDVPPGGRDLWDRTNHAGETVSLLEGPAFVAGSSLAAVAAGPGPLVAALGAGSSVRSTTWRATPAARDSRATSARWPEARSPRER